MLAERPRTPWRSAFAALVIAAAVYPASTPVSGPGNASCRGGGPWTFVHAKLVTKNATLAGLSADDIRPLFTVEADDDRARWVRLEFPGDAASVERVVAELVKDPHVEQTIVATESTIAHHGEQHLEDDESCPFTTTSFESYQGYLGPAPHGIDASAAWRRGFRGAGVWFADIEGGWNA